MTINSFLINVLFINFIVIYFIAHTVRMALDSFLGGMH